MTNVTLPRVGTALEGKLSLPDYAGQADPLALEACLVQTRVTLWPKPAGIPLAGGGEGVEGSQETNVRHNTARHIV